MREKEKLLIIVENARVGNGGGGGRRLLTRGSKGKRTLGHHPGMCNCYLSYLYTLIHR
jgi:hypothetical protein